MPGKDLQTLIVGQSETALALVVTKGPRGSLPHKKTAAGYPLQPSSGFPLPKRRISRSDMPSRPHDRSGTSPFSSPYTALNRGT